MFFRDSSLNVIPRMVVLHCLNTATCLGSCPSLPVSSCVTLGKLLERPEPWANNACLTRSWQRPDEVSEMHRAWRTLVSLLPSLPQNSCRRPVCRIFSPHSPFCGLDSDPPAHPQGRQALAAFLSAGAP